jgi:hypothetical protein
MYFHIFIFKLSMWTDFECVALVDHLHISERKNACETFQYQKLLFINLDSARDEKERERPVAEQQMNQKVEEIRYNQKSVTVFCFSLVFRFRRIKNREESGNEIGV